MKDPEKNSQAGNKKLEINHGVEQKKHLNSNESYECNAMDCGEFMKVQNYEGNNNSYENNKINYKQVTANHNLINEKINEYNEDNQNPHKMTDICYDIEEITLEESSKVIKMGNNLSNKDSINLNNSIKHDDYGTLISDLKNEKINFTDEAYTHDKVPRKIIYENYTSDRREEIKVLLESICNLKSNKKESKGCIVTKLLSSKGICNGMLTELPLYEELLKHLFTKRDLTEQTFESECFEELLIDRNDENDEHLINLKVENTEIYFKRRSVFESIINFAVKRISINQDYVNKLENHEINFEDELLSPLKAYYELFKRDNVIFFEIATIREEFPKNCLVPLTTNEAYIYFSNANLTHKMRKFKRELNIISSYSTGKESNMFEKELQEFVFIIKKLMGDNTLLRNISNVFFPSKITDENFDFTFKNLGVNNISIAKVNIGTQIREFRKFMMNSLFGNKFNEIDRRLFSLYQFFSFKDANEEMNSKSIASKLIDLEKMLRAIIPNSDSVSNILQKKIQMENSLLDGFRISETRKSDLKKISNLVKSKVLFHSGRRSTKHEAEGCESEVNEMNSCKAIDNEKMRLMLKDLNKILDKESVQLFDNLAIITGRVLEKEDIIKCFLSTVDRIENCERMHTESLVNLNKIKDITQLLLNSMKKKLAVPNVAYKKALVSDNGC